MLTWTLVSTLLFLKQPVKLNLPDVATSPCCPVPAVGQRCWWWQCHHQWHLKCHLKLEHGGLCGGSESCSCWCRFLTGWWRLWFSTGRGAGAALCFVLMVSAFQVTEKVVLGCRFTSSTPSIALPGCCESEAGVFRGRSSGCSAVFFHAQTNCFCDTELFLGFCYGGSGFTTLFPRSL